MFSCDSDKTLNISETNKYGGNWHGSMTCWPEVAFMPQLKFCDIPYSFDIPIGTVRSSDNKVTSYDRTQWTTACDLKNKCFYYRTENNSRIKVLNLMKCKLDSNKIIKLKMASFEKAENITTDLK